MVHGVTEKLLGRCAGEVARKLSCRVLEKTVDKEIAHQIYYRSLEVLGRGQGMLEAGR